MNIFKFVPTILTFCLILGILIGFSYSFPIWTILLCIGFIFILLWIAYYFSYKRIGNHLYFNVLTYILFILIGILSISIQDNSRNAIFYKNFIKEDNQIYLTVTKRLKPTNYHYKYEARINRINHQKALGKILLNIRKDSLVKEPKIGQIYYTKTAILPINKPKNPYSFDYSKYLKTKQIFHQIIVNSDALFFIKENKSFKSTSAKILEKIHTNLKKQPFNKDVLSIINALLLGQRQDISKDLITNYQNAGAIHILAVSGLHIGVLFGILLILFFPLQWLLPKNKAKILQYLLAIACLWFYAFLIGMSASVVRSATMFSALAIGVLINRNQATIKNLFISAFLLLLIHPYYLMDVGFQLSYLAVISIIYWNPIFNKLWIPQNKIVNFFWKIVTVSISAQIGVLPLSLYYFHQFPALFFISGLIVLPVLGIILGFGFLVIVLAYFDSLPIVLANIYAVIIQFLNQFIQFIANQESYIFKNIFFTTSFLIISYVLIITLYRLLNRFSFKNLVYLFISVIVLQSVIIYNKYARVNEKAFTIFHHSKNTIIGIQNKDTLIINHSLDSINTVKSIQNYVIGTGVSNIKTIPKIKNYYTFNKHKILIIDSLGMYKLNSLNPNIVLLRNSPKINLERMIYYLKPDTIVVDASNYSSYSNYYQSVSEKLKTPFYNTKQKGAFILKR